MELPGLKVAIAAALRPSRTEVIRAKRLVLELLGSGKVVDCTELEHALATAEAAEARPDEAIPIVTRDPAASVAVDHPQIRYLRLRSAGVEAVAEVAAQGMAVAVGGDLKPWGEFPFKHETREGSTLRTGTVRVDAQLPALAPAYRLAHNLLTAPAVVPGCRPLPRRPRDPQPLATADRNPRPSFRRVSTRPLSRVRKSPRGRQRRYVVRARGTFRAQVARCGKHSMGTEPLRSRSSSPINSETLRARRRRRTRCWRTPRCCERFETSADIRGRTPLMTSPGSSPNRHALS